MLNFLPFGLLAGHSATWTEICAVLAAITIYAVIALIVTLIEAALGDGLLGAAISFAVAAVAALAGWLIWALALSADAATHGQLAFQHAFVLLVCRNLILVLALVAFLWFVANLDDLISRDYVSDRYASRARDVLGAFLCFALTCGLIFAALVFPY